MSPEILQADAKEMAAALRGADCLQRHGVLSYDKLAEILTALCTRGHLHSRNAAGSDVTSPAYGRIEVRSRFLGTDGPFPRVTLSQGKLQGAEWFMAVRWDAGGDVHAAVMLPFASVAPLFAARLQKSGNKAHIAWCDWLSAPGLVDLTADFRAALSAL